MKCGMINMYPKSRHKPQLYQPQECGRSRILISAAVISTPTIEFTTKKKYRRGRREEIEYSDIARDIYMRNRNRKLFTGKQISNVNKSTAVNETDVLVMKVFTSISSA